MRPSKRSTALVAAALLLPASVFGVAVLGSDAGAESGVDAPLATATARDLRTTETVSGTLARAETKTIVHGGTSSGGGGLRIAAASTPLECATPEATPSPSPDPTPSQSPTPTPSPSPSPSPCASPTPTPSPSPTLSPTPTPSPSPTPSPDPPPDPTPSPDPPPPPLDPQPQPESQTGNGGPSGRTPEGGAPVTSGTPTQNAARPDAPGDDQTAPRAATLTGVLEVGAVADRGSVLYAADTEPVVALIAPEALFRDLSTSSSDGDDIKFLEENLVAMGYGSNLTVDRHFDSATATAVKKWEEALGRQAPDGVVSVGEVVFLPEPATVISRQAGVGDKLNVGTPVLTLGTRSMVVTAMVEVADRQKWATGTVVGLDWADQPGTGTVIEVGRDEVDGSVEVTIVLGADAPEAPVGAEVGATATTAERTGVVTVPVSAIVEGPDGPAVREEDGSVVPVKIGIVSGGLAEITSGLEEGSRVRLPG